MRISLIMIKYILILSFLSIFLYFIQSFMIFMILTIWVLIQSFFSIFNKYSFDSKNINDLLSSIISSCISWNINLLMIFTNDIKWIYKYLQIINFENININKIINNFDFMRDKVENLLLNK